jgi:four helix bundle protein
MSTVTKFEDLEVWKLARELCKVIGGFTGKADFYRDFSLKDQIKRSSGSTMDNVAEGFGRGGNREFIHFLTISNGSALALAMFPKYKCK